MQTLSLKINPRTASSLITIYFFVLLIGSLVINQELLIGPPVLERGDLAVNATDIRDAKNLSELYGNYSRWGFSHPGPAFFYVYASAEYLLYDLLAVVSSPHGAHLAASIVLQIALAGISVWILVYYVFSSTSVLVLLAIFSIHFSMAATAYSTTVFASIWPPMVLLGPTMLFVAAASALASGFWTWGTLLAAVVSMGLLVHGHVAQILFVAPILVFVVYRASLTRKNLWQELSRSAKGRVTIVLLAIFGLPILIDLFYGASSNFAKYVAWLEADRDSANRNAPFVFLASFFFYESNIKQAIESGQSLWQMLLSKPYWALCLFVILASGVGAVGYRARNWPKSFNMGIMNLCLILGLYSVLSIVWAMIIAGGYFTFNAYYFIAIVFLIISAAVIPLVDLFGQSACRVWPRSLISLSLAIIMFPTLAAKSDVVDRASVVEALGNVGLPSGNNVEIIVFFSPDQWPAAASAIIHLERAGHKVKVPRRWGILYDEGRTIDSYEAIKWRKNAIFITSGKCGATPALAEWGGCIIRDPPGPTLGPGSPIEFKRGSGAMSLASVGMSGSEESFTWTESERVKLLIELEDGAQGNVLVMDVAPFLAPGNGVEYQRGEISINNQKAASVTLSERQKIQLRLPESVVTSRELVLEMHLPDAVAPSELGVSSDSRSLGWALYSLEIVSE